METFINIYNNYIVQSLILYEIEKSKSIDDDVFIHRIELEFNEERGIEIELDLKTTDALNMLNVFYMIVCDARYAYYENESGNYENLEDYMECNLGAKKLCFLVGNEIYNKLMICLMDYRA